MKFEKLSKAPVNNGGFSGGNQLEASIFPAGTYPSKLKIVKSVDKKTNAPLKTKNGKEKFLLIWEVYDGKGKAFSIVYDNHLNDDTNKYTTRKFAHLVDATNYEPPQDEFFYEFADYLLEDFSDKMFNVAFKPTKDETGMEVDLFVEEGEAMYEVVKKTRAKRTVAEAPAPIEDEETPVFDEPEEAVDDLEFNDDEDSFEEADQFLTEALADEDGEDSDF